MEQAEAESIPPSTLRPEELEAVYAISRAVALAENIDSALDEIIRLARPVFIFDNMVLYLRGKDTVEPAYARAIGRGRYKEAELSWGETTAHEVLHTGKLSSRVEESSEKVADRTRVRHLLGLPLFLESQLEGALVFIRFGGPPYTPDQVRLAEFIAGLVAQLIGHDRLVKRIAHLEAERKLNQLQEDFIATISHELLTPLGFIKGYATTLLRDDITWDEETRREFLTIIDEESDRLRELIENLMDSSRLQAGTLKMSFQPLRLDAFLRDIVLRALSLHDNIRIELQKELPELRIVADATRLAQVFDNLLTNASKYAPQSTVTISVREEPQAVHICVSDNGPGIAPQHLGSLFKRFFRVPTPDRNIRGTGLGLFICRQIVQAHRGEIWAESQLGHGTTFHIRLPYSQPKLDHDLSLRESSS
ncbi:MAG: HAMP domain-containing sensor histidine kinase [Anaerolineales bacterium]|nr:HAMP domain-containing histidine kinase [Anaerolineales bacterium]MDW8446258.1 HAMP domain-containing sensor histidine kinase [Anaerolineales bacterium]